jgi:hypothetical protein
VNSTLPAPMTAIFATAASLAPTEHRVDLDG